MRWRARAVRFGIGRGNTAEELAWVAERLIALVRELRAKRARPGAPKHALGLESLSARAGSAALPSAPTP